jgi:uncharacterized protein (DUF58 family)
LESHGRLEKLFLKLFHDEEDISLHLLIDSSMSMAFGDPLTKWHYAQRAAAAIGFVALHGNNRVDASSFNTSVAGRTAPLRGDSGIPQFLTSLSRLPEPGGATRFSETIRRYASNAPPAGVVVIFSDFFDPTITDGLISLVGRRHQVILVQILAREEIDPTFVGDVSLIDSESGQTHNLLIGDLDITDYRQRLDQYQSDLFTVANKYNMSFIPVVSDEPLDDLVLSGLMSTGLLI